MINFKIPRFRNLVVVVPVTKSDLKISSVLCEAL